MLKKVMRCYYAHNSNYKEWESKVLEYMNKDEFKNLMDFVKDVYDNEIGIDSYVLKFDAATNRISIISAPDWDTENEPTVGDSIVAWIDDNGEFQSKKIKGKNQIYHNKWQFVQPDYSGFDVEAAKERTKLWNSIPDIAKHKSRIGYRAYWNDLLAKNGIEESRHAKRIKLRIDERILTEAFTKEQVQQIFDEMYDEFLDYSDDLDFCTQARVDRNVKWTRTNATRKLGHCKFKGYDYGGCMEISLYEIALNPALLRLADKDERVIRDVIAHEFCHTLPDCLNHGPEFHRKARIIKDLMGYHIDTKIDEEGGALFVQALMSEGAPYKVICQNCGAESEFPKLTPQIKEAHQYYCKKCNQPYLIAYKLNKKTGKYEIYNKNAVDTFRYFHKLPFIDDFQPIET